MIAALGGNFDSGGNKPVVTMLPVVAMLPVMAMLPVVTMLPVVAKLMLVIALVWQLSVHCYQWFQLLSTPTWFHQDRYQNECELPDDADGD